MLALQIRFHELPLALCIQLNIGMGGTPPGRKVTFLQSFARSSIHLKIVCLMHLFASCKISKGNWAIHEKYCKYEWPNPILPHHHHQCSYAKKACTVSSRVFFKSPFPSVRHLPSNGFSRICTSDFTGANPRGEGYRVYCQRAIESGAHHCCQIHPLPQPLCPILQLPTQFCPLPAPVLPSIYLLHWLTCSG